MGNGGRTVVVDVTKGKALVLSPTNAVVVPASSPSSPDAHGAHCEDESDISSSIWYFKAPAPFVNSLPKAYGGRLQFQLMSPSHSGTPRTSRGALLILAEDGSSISCDLKQFGTPDSDWTRYSAVLREDHGWRREPRHELLTAAEMKHFLTSATQLLIRGDHWTYSEAGSGQGIVYINNVGLFAA
jgi:hypothetical protein